MNTETAWKNITPATKYIPVAPKSENYTNSNSAHTPGSPALDQLSREGNSYGKS